MECAGMIEDIVDEEYYFGTINPSVFRGYKYYGNGGRVYRFETTLKNLPEKLTGVELREAMQSKPLPPEKMINLQWPPASFFGGIAYGIKDRWHPEINGDQQPWVRSDYLYFNNDVEKFFEWCRQFDACNEIHIIR